MRTKIWVALICGLLLLYLVLTFQRAVLLLADLNWVAKALGIAMVVLPIIGAWSMIRELNFGFRTEKLAKTLAAEGGLPVDDLPRTPGGRIKREAADAKFQQFKAEAEAAPEEWRSWFRLSCAYDAAGDRRRARSAMRQAIRLQRAQVQKT